MNKHPITTTDDQIDAAIKRGRAFDARSPRAVSVTYRPISDTIAITLSNGVVTSIPRKIIQGLSPARESALHKIVIVGNGTGLSWPDLDVDHHVAGLLQGIVGTKRWMEQRQEAGRAKSPAKANAARANGRKGGRPKKRELVKIAESS